jgi:hypothetical protein
VPLLSKVVQRLNTVLSKFFQTFSSVVFSFVFLEATTVRIAWNVLTASLEQYRAHAYPDYYLKSFLISVRAALSVLFAIVIESGSTVEYRAFEILSDIFICCLFLCVSRSHQMRNCTGLNNGQFEAI